MDGAAVKEMDDRFRAPQQIGDFVFRPADWVAEDPEALIKPGPLAKTLGVSTLGAVRDYLVANRDALDPATLAVHVVSPACVQILGPLTARARVRETFVDAKATDYTDGFMGKFMPVQDFIVGLQVRFADAGDRQAVLQLLSSVREESVRTADDDGMTQVVTARAGVVMVGVQRVPNPVILCGYRTFRDVEQPASAFMLRVQDNKAGGLPDVMLCEADGGAWRLSAISRVRDWLVRELPAGLAVYA
jgi:hypothetical protein